MARQARRNRVHSAVTYQANVIEAGKVNVHAALLKFASGQLPFLGYNLWLKKMSSQAIPAATAQGSRSRSRATSSPRPRCTWKV